MEFKPSIYFLFYLLLGSQSLLAQENGQSKAPDPLNWQTEAQLNELDSMSRPVSIRHCGGTYYNSELSENIDSASFSQVEIRADRSSLLKNGWSLLEGDVSIRNGNRLITAQAARVHQQEKNAELTGPVSVQTPSASIHGESALMELDSEQADIKEASFSLHKLRARGSADALKQLDRNNLELTGASYTTCPPEDNSWLFSGQKILLDQEDGWGKAHHVVLRLKDIPVIYTPYLEFPIDDRRRSGILAPSIGSSEKTGMDIVVPFYLNIAPQYDATFYPRHIHDRGNLLETEFRYLGGDHEMQTAEGELGVSYIGNDQMFHHDLEEAFILRNEIEKANAGLAATGTTLTEYNAIRDEVNRFDETRKLAYWKHFSRLGNNWVANTDVNYVSDEFYLSDLGSDLNLNRSAHLNREGRVEYFGEELTLTGKVKVYQTIGEYISEENLPWYQLPKFSVQYFPFSKNNFGYSLGASSSGFSRNTDLINDQKAQRSFLDAAFHYNLEWEWGYFTPAYKVRQLDYASRTNNTFLGDDTELQSIIFDATGISVPVEDIQFGAGNPFDHNTNHTFSTYTVDTSLFFERPVKLAFHDYVHTLEPRLFYVYVPYKNQADFPLFDTTEPAFNYSQLFRDNRFSGGDRIGDTNQITYALTTRLYDTESGREKASFTIGQIYYFKNRLTGLNGNQLQKERQSSVAMAGDYRLNKFWRIHGEANWKERFTEDGLGKSDQIGKFESGNLKFTWQDSKFRTVNLAYRYAQNSLEQADTSFIYPVVGHWSLIGRSRFDLVNHRSLENIYGVEYDSCCWRMRLVGHRVLKSSLEENHLRPDSGVLFQVELKGLLTSGKNLDGLLDKAIPGYRKREKELFSDTAN